MTQIRQRTYHLTEQQVSDAIAQYLFREHPELDFGPWHTHIETTAAPTILKMKVILRRVNGESAT